MHYLRKGTRNGPTGRLRMQYWHDNFGDAPPPAAKADLQAMLAEAAKNTAAQSDPAVEEFARVAGPLLKGKRH